MKNKIHDHACINCFTGKGECLGECNVTDTNKALADSFEEVTRPVIKWLAQNVHPHHSVIIDSTHAELLEGQSVVHTEEYLRD
ncbi:hypothetical protein BBB57_01215 [Kosakonia sacchari]|uniref:hypothetical protein n=1 Tax=Kosakonia sacchari TaxID=1158459 RepID=UPI0008075AC9|nr:hypothetical protein [Kosakonia sacchari]ANR76994.1 hypothetical protein BBB57_01215 [Kosakonia sacchari]